MAELEKKNLDTSWKSPFSKSIQPTPPKPEKAKRSIPIIPVAVGAGVAIAALIWLFTGSDDSEPGASAPSTSASKVADTCAGNAEDCWLAAAQAGDPAAQFRLAMAYAAGEGITDDLLKASEWYGKALAQNYPDAQFYMGEIYYNGRGVPKDDQLAQEWYSKAAAQGHKVAKQRLDQIAKESGAAS